VSAVLVLTVNYHTILLTLARNWKAQYAVCTNELVLVNSHKRQTHILTTCLFNTHMYEYPVLPLTHVANLYPPVSGSSTAIFFPYCVIR